MSVAAPLSAAEALSSLLWQPYECRSPPLPRSQTDGALALRWWGTRDLQSPNGGRHARASPRAHTLRPVMRLPVPAPSPGKPESVSVRVSGEPARPENVSSVNIVQVSDPPSPVICSNSAVQTERERTTASAECQTEEPARRRRPRRPRAARCATLGPDLPPPPYSTLPPAAPAPIPLPAIVHAPPPMHPPPAIISTTHSPHHRFPFQPIPFRSGRGAAYACSEGEGTPKSCCGRPPLRLCVLFLGVVGACLVAAGAVLGALRPHPRAPLTLLLLMIGIGVVLVTAAGLAWRLGARDAPCALLGLRRASCRRFVPRLPPSYARPHHPYAAMLYPEFQYRPPPPTYQASMQEYRLRLLLLDRSPPAISPPPTYRSNSTSLVRGSSRAGWCGSEYSGPPSYRAPRSSPAVTVTDAIPTLTQLELKYPDPVPDSEPKIDQEKDPEHLVTIVHTDAQPVIVTVSGSTALNEINETQAQPPTEMDILAHL